MHTLRTPRGVFPLAFVLVIMALLVTTADAFCGFYVAKADTKLFNQASKVAIARHDNKTVLTMANDYQGDPKEFALVVPVPTVLERDQIHVTEPVIIDHLDAYTAPRLVEYFDRDPCQPLPVPMAAMPSPRISGSVRQATAPIFRGGIFSGIHGRVTVRSVKRPNSTLPACHSGLKRKPGILRV